MASKRAARSGLVFLVLLVGALLAPVVVAASPGDAAKGEAIFKQKCAACHTVGGGKTVGPDLKDIGAKRDREWLTRFITEPDKVLAAKDPIATALLQEYNNIPMPNMGISKTEVEDVLAFLAPGTVTTTPPPPTTATSPPPTSAIPPPPPTATVISPSPTASPPLPSATSITTPVSPTPSPAPAPLPTTLPGNPQTGRDLFTGNTPLKNGGTPCIACHNIGGLEGLQGGALAPDLTATFSKYGDAGTASILSTLPFPAMKPLYGDKPLTPEEITDLKVFLQQAGTEQSSPVAGRLIVYILIGLAVLILVVQIVWRRRLAGVRKSLLLLR
ncbi:MAG: c-type cytochrome [Chloroflexi bacterium]|nr:c-type cytochrome [Chloroflexota bacterium]